MAIAERGTARDLKPVYKVVIDGAPKTWSIARISPINKSIEEWTGEFSVGNITVEFIDQDRKIWDFFFSSGGTNPINLPFELQAGFGSDFQTQFRGRITDISVTEHRFIIQAKDNLKNLSEARFLWDYEDTEITLESDVRGSVFYITDETRFKGSFAGGGTSGTGGEKILFEAGGLGTIQLGSRQEYRVNSAEWLNGTGTLTLDLEPIEYFGKNIYKRKILQYSGNPFQIFMDILTGTNIDPQFTESDFELANWGTGTRITVPMNFRKIIVDEEKGAVMNEIKNLCESIPCSLYISEDNKFVFKPLRPQILPTGIDNYSERDNIIEGFEYRFPLENIYTKVVLEYNLNQDLGSYTGKIEKSVDDFDGLIKEKNIQSDWIRNPDEAVVVAGRWLNRHKKGIGEITLPTTLYGITATLSDFIDVTHRWGRLGSKAFEIVGYRKDFDQGRIELDCLDGEDLHWKKGYAWFEDGVVGDISMGIQGSTLVSGTSMSGWGTNLQNLLQFDAVGRVDNNIDQYQTDIPIYNASFWKIKLGTYIKINNEILGTITSKVNDNGQGTISVKQRGAFNTDPQNHTAGAWIYIAGTGNPIATCLNIDVGTHGTVFKWW